MSLFGDYIKERAGKQIVEDEFGFATYSFIKEGCYIEDLYVIPAQRKSGHASRLADRIVNVCKSKGCTALIGTVATGANGATDSLKVLLAYGFKLQSAQNEMVLLRKEI